MIIYMLNTSIDMKTAKNSCEKLKQLIEIRVVFRMIYLNVNCIRDEKKHNPALKYFTYAMNMSNIYKF